MNAVRQPVVTKVEAAKLKNQVAVYAEVGHIPRDVTQVEIMFHTEAKKAPRVGERLRLNISWNGEDE
jgi:hypothetical protein